MNGTHGNQKWISLGVIFFIVIVSAYFVGFRSGMVSIPPESQVSGIANIDSQKPQSVDFAPFWTVWNILNEKYVGTSTSDEKKVYGAIEGLTASLGDPYTVFFPPAESKMFQTEIAGRFEGVGMEVGIKDGKLVVVSPIKDSPAEKAGVKPGDFILKIDDKDSINMPTDEAVELIRGTAGTTVTLTLRREDVKNAIEVPITRARIDLPTINTEKKGDVFVIALYSFNENSANLFRGALRQFVASNTHKLVIDLRGNPGGYLDAAVDMASWFLPGGKVVVREEFRKNEEEVTYRSKGYNIFTDKLKMVMLIDGGSASASEILAGALSQNGKATLVGEKTFGKGSVQELIYITPETSLKVTIANWLTPNGTSISKHGITPDYEVKLEPEDLKQKRDPAMEKALELLSLEP